MSDYFGKEVPKLGFGLMRLPQHLGRIDVEQVKKMVDRFLGAGFTYFDTAFVYTGSEEAIRKALVERYPRESYTLATKVNAFIVEAIDAHFARRFWEYIAAAGYEHRNKSTGAPQFYRFTNPKSQEFPAMIELFTRRLDDIPLPEDAVLTPLPMDDNISSLSAILLKRVWNRQ